MLMSGNQTIGTNIRRLRLAAGLRQAELAAAGNISRSHLTWVERGRDGLSVSSLTGIAEALNTTVEDLQGVSTPQSVERSVGRQETAEAAVVMGIYYVLDDGRREIATRYLTRLARAAERERAAKQKSATRRRQDISPLDEPGALLAAPKNRHK